jgi:cytochrome c oxidase cbb3-type subunit 2
MNAVAVRAMLTVAAVYGFFLLFAQFAFVEITRGAGTGHIGEKFLLGCMALAGVVSGFVTAWRGARPEMIRGALLSAAMAAATAAVSGMFPLALLAAILTGGALGVATVSLAALLPGWCGVIPIGLGTGIGYAFCNLPWIFQATPEQQAWIAAVMATMGAIAVPPLREWKRECPARAMPFVAAIVLFTALVWLDSAAFFVIQHVEDLKSGTWGESLLWRNAALHLALAVAAGVALTRMRPTSVPLIGWLVLAIAALAVNADSSRVIAGWLYPAGVSIYSVALVVWPGWFSGAENPKSAAWRAAWLFAIAGWFGSANGIGMAQSLSRVPVAFIVIAGVAVLTAVLLSNRSHFGSAIAASAVALVGLTSAGRDEPPRGSAAARGRAVYLAEGCIHCHSRYTRPETADESFWGPSPAPAAVLAEKPVLIGNRRQGPDLTNVGARRSEAWLKAHFIDPRSLVPDSVMPSYAHLFEDGRGDDLVRYLKESGIETTASLLQRQSAWAPGGTSLGIDARVLYKRHCASCHGAFGGGFGPVAAKLNVKPANLRKGPFLRTGAPGHSLTAIARVIRFGVIGSDMPGHETLTDSEIIALSEMLAAWRTTE